MIEDFLSYVDESFPFLNPYDSFHQCKRNPELLSRRIYNLLKSISLDESKVKYHRGWGFYIETPYDQIQQIGLIPSQNEKGFNIELSMYFADTQSQAVSFYKSSPRIGHLKNTGWDYYANFHVSFMTSHLMWFESEDDEKYLQFWKDHVELIRQQKRADIPIYFKRLVDEKVINMTQEAEENLNVNFYDTAMQTLNICPGFGFILRLVFWRQKISTKVES
jgi:hypothetical protein